MSASADKRDIEPLLASGFRFAYSLTHCVEDSEDLVQQAWLRLFQAYGEVANRAILFTTLRNLFYDQLRRQQIATFEVLDPSDLDLREGLLNETPGVRGDLEELLGHLEPREREVLYLNGVEGYSAREVGEMMDNTPRNTILAIMSRARRKLERIAETQSKAEQNSASARNRSKAKQ